MKELLYSERISMRVTDEDKKLIKDISDKYNISMSHIFRVLLKASIKQEFWDKWDESDE